jgi:FkbM family methyltransferase
LQAGRCGDKRHQANAIEGTFVDRHFFRDSLRALRRTTKRLLPDVSCTLYGCTITIPSALHRGVLAKVRSGDYETPERELISEHLRPDIPVIELGGSLGVVGAFAAKRLAPGTRMISIEANPNIIGYCRKNLSSNSAGSAEVLHRVVAYGTEKAPFYISDNIHISRTEPFAGSRRVDVETTTIAELLERVGSKQFQLIMDIEGAEVDVIREESSIFKKCVLAIIEFHPSNYSEPDNTTTEMISILKEQGLELIGVLETTHAFKRV